MPWQAVCCHVISASACVMFGLALDLTCAGFGLVHFWPAVICLGLPSDSSHCLSILLPVQAHADEAEGPAAALSQVVAAATALGTVGDSEEPDTALTLSQHKASAYPSFCH